MRDFWPNPSYDEMRYRECIMCGYNQYMATIDFTAGTVEPVAGETLTGALSGDTAIVDSVQLTSGTYAGGDAAGRILCITPTSWDRLQYSIFTPGESITGSTGGAGMLTVTNGDIRVNSRLSAEAETVLVDGVRYCQYHYQLRWPKRLLAEYIPDADEQERTNN